MEAEAGEEAEVGVQIEEPHVFGQGAYLSSNGHGWAEEEVEV